MKFLLRLLLRLVYGFRAYNTEVLKTPGPVLLVPNHVSWLDWLFIGVCIDDDWRFVTSSETAKTTWLHRRIMVNKRTFPIDATSPYAVKHMAEYLQGGGRLVLFAEGRITRTGSMMKLYDGTGFLLHKTQSKIITAYLRGVNRIPWVRHNGWTRWFQRTSAHFSTVLTPPHLEKISTQTARNQLSLWLRRQMNLQQFEVDLELGPQNVLDAIGETGDILPGKEILEDVSRQTLTYRRLFTGIDLLQVQWMKRLDSDQRVGLLLPNVNGLVVSILSLWASGKVPAILNFSSGIHVICQCAELAAVKHIITSRQFLTKAKIDPAPLEKAGIELIFLEEVRAGISRVTRIAALMRRYFGFKPALHRPSAKEAAVILFTSGSEGTPKGVELTHRNLMANILQMMTAADFTDHERVFNALPIFHSFGLAAGTLLPLVRGFYTFLYPSPLHYRVVPYVVYDRHCTILLGTNTFLNGYARKANAYDFYSVRYVFAGAEKIQESTYNAWARNFGVRILEGYGATECSPAITLNTLACPCFGSVGQFLPAIEHKIIPVEGVNDGGQLWVRGPNVMRGYLNPDANTKFQALGGWYDTGDIVKVDVNGFVFILGRLKRFAKVSGEMVSLTAVEDALANSFPQFGLRFQVAVLSRSDPEKGEALVVATNESKLSLSDVRRAIINRGFSNLCVPREIIVVREIPKLGTGKVNHRELAKTLFAQPSASAGVSGRNP